MVFSLTNVLFGSKTHARDVWTLLSASMKRGRTAVVVPCSFECLQTRDDGLGESAGTKLTTKITGSLTGSDRLENGVLDSVCLVKEAHVPKHHDGREQKRSRVGFVLTSNVGCGTVDGLEDGSVLANVTRRGETQTTNQTGAHVGKDIAVQVGHDHDPVSVWCRVLDDAETGTVEQVLVVSNVGVLLSNLSASVEEHSVGHSHDRCLVNGGDLVSAILLGVVESVSGDTFGSFVSDKLDGLYHTIHDLVFNAGVLSFGVFTDEHSVDVVVSGLETFDGLAWSNVRKEVEGSSEGQVERDVTLTDRGSEGTLECDSVLLDGDDGLFRDGLLAVLDEGSDGNFLPLDGDVGSAVDLLDGVGDFGTDTVTGDHRDGVLAVRALLLVVGRGRGGSDGHGKATSRDFVDLERGRGEARALGQRRAGRSECGCRKHDELQQRRRRPIRMIEREREGIDRGGVEIEEEED